MKTLLNQNRVRIQKEMSDYQAQLLQIKNMSEERKYVGQINRLKNLELSLSDFEEKVRADQVGRDLADQYQAEAQAKKDELDRLYQEMQSLQDKITPLKETIDNLRSKMNAIGAERKELYVQKDAKHAELNERWTKWKAHLEQQKKKEADALDKTPPYASSLTAAKTCLSCLQTLQKKTKKPKKDAKAPEEEKATEEGAEPVQAEAEEPAQPENVPLTHDLAVYRAFEALSLLPPTESSQIPDAINKVKARQQELQRLNDQVMQKRSDKSVKADAQEEPQQNDEPNPTATEDN